MKTSEILFTVLLSAAMVASASHLNGHPGDQAMTPAEVRKVDLDASKITLRHGEILNLGMPSMTMVFQVRETALLENLKSGDKVLFVAEKVNGAFVVTAIELAK